MNRLFLTASKSAASPRRCSHAADTSLSVAHFLTARRFSDSADAADDDVDIKVGTVQFFNGGKQGFGYILPDGVDRHNHDAKDVFFIHRTGIKSARREYGNFLGLTKGLRVQFKAGPPDEGKASGRGERRLDAHHLSLHNVAKI